MSHYKLTITKSSEASSTESAPELIYVHEIADEAAMRKMIHELNKPVRKPRTPKAKTT